VERDVVGLDDVGEGLRHEVEDVEVLAHGEGAESDAALEDLQLGGEVVHPQTGDPEAGEHLLHDLVSLADGLASHVAEVETFDTGLEVRPEEGHESQQHAHGVELGLLVGPVHRGDPGGDVTLVEDVLECLGDLECRDGPLQLLEHAIARAHDGEVLPGFTRLQEVRARRLADEGGVLEAG